MSSSNECFENYYYGKNLKYSFLRQLLSTQIIFCEKKNSEVSITYLLLPKKFIIFFFIKKISVVVALRVLILLIILIPDRFYIFTM